MKLDISLRGAYTGCMRKNTLLALAALLLPLLLGALACDDKNHPFPCVPGAKGFEGGVSSGVVISSDTEACVQNAVSGAVALSTGTTPGGDPSGTGTNPAGTGVSHPRRGP